MKRTIEVSNETWERIKDQLGEDDYDVTELKDIVGKKFLFRAVTYHCVGRVTKLIGKFAELENASWVADSGQFSETIAKGTLNEVEPVGTMYVNLDTVVDFFPWKHNLPEEVK
jgi:hypothetical protein